VTNRKLLVALLLLAAAAVGVVLLLGGLQVAAAIAVAITTAVVAGWVLGRQAERRALEAPLSQIAESLEMLGASDIFSVIDTLASLVQGERPRRLEIHASTVSLPVDRRARRVASALNTTISRLTMGAQQVFAASAEACRRHFYVGPDDYLLGCAAAEAMGARLPDGGEVLLLTVPFRHVGLELRRRGFENTLRERFPTARVAGVLETRRDTVATRENVRAFIKLHPRLAGAYCTESTGVPGALEAITRAGLVGRTVVICHDTVDAVVAGIRAGSISATVTQHPYGQGHDTVIDLFNAVVHGWRPAEPRIVSSSSLVTRENLGQFLMSGEGVIESEVKAALRPTPHGRAARPIRIAVLGLSDSPFWESIRAGVLAAGTELKPLNAAVEWIVPEGDGGLDVAVRGPAVDALAEAGYDAIATVNYDSDLIPYLNRAVDRGVVVSTLNAESSSLQDLVATLSKQRKDLEKEAGDLEIAATHDSLTGALNRLVMDGDLQKEWDCFVDGQRPVSVIMIDIDHFKAYNDLYGHAAGDEALRLVARRIQKEIRPTDRLYRYGGEEFLVLLRDTGIDAGEAVATRIARGITTLGLAHDGNRPWGVVTVSAGVAAADRQHRSANDCVSDADAAMYRSKRSGRNTVATYQGEAKPMGGAIHEPQADRRGAAWLVEDVGPVDPSAGTTSLESDAELWPPESRVG
jgi:diguanylate cyclase (GGDEF)-like protein